MRILTITIALLALLAMPAFAAHHEAGEKADAETEAAATDVATEPPADAAEGEAEAAEETEAAEDKD